MEQAEGGGAAKAPGEGTSADGSPHGWDSAERRDDHDYLKKNFDEPERLKKGIGASVEESAHQ